MSDAMRLGRRVAGLVSPRGSVTHPDVCSTNQIVESKNDEREEKREQQATGLSLFYSHSVRLHSDDSWT